MNRATAIGVCMLVALVGTSAFLWAEFEEGQSITMQGYIRVAERDISGNITSLDFVTKDTNEVLRISCEEEGSKARELCDHEGQLVEIQGTLRKAEGEPTDASAPAWFLDVAEYKLMEEESPAEEPVPPEYKSAQGMPADQGEAESPRQLELQGEFRVSEFDDQGNAKAMEFVESGTGKIYKVFNDENHEKYVELAGKPILLTGELKADEAGEEWLHVIEYKMEEEEESPTIPEEGEEE